MKKIMIFIFFLNSPLSASVYCLSNTKNLTEDFDDKEWHSVACDCPCNKIKGRHCIECGHLQNAHTYVVVVPTKIAQPNKQYLASDPQRTFKKLVLGYIHKRKN